MTNKLRDFLNQQSNTQRAVNYGTQIHKKLQFIDIIDSDDVLNKIKAMPELMRFFDAKSKPEVPVAGYINNNFVSRRIDRLRIDTDNKVIEILDFKTDTDQHVNKSHYAKQLNEYKILLHDIYPDYQINCYILWVHNLEIEQI